MRIRSDEDRIKSLIITEPDESDHYGEMMKNFFRTEKARYPIWDYAGMSPDTWRRRRRALLKRLSEALGPFPAQKTALRARVTPRCDRGDYTVEGVSFYSRPNWPVSALFYLPKGAAATLPAVLLVHGHCFAQKAAAAYQKVAIHLAKNGYAVLAVDFVGGGERKAQGHENLSLLMAGLSVQSLMIRDNMRAVDYLLTRREVDPRRIGITGQSGGGNQTVFTTIFDERIKASCPVAAACMFDEHEAVGIDNFCPCEVIPGIWTFAEYSDLLALIAPRPLLISHSTKDRLFPIKGAREACDRARELYRSLGAAGSIEFAEDYGGHSYNSIIRAGVIAFFDKHLKGIAPSGIDAYRDFITVEHEESEVLRAFPGGNPPEGTLTLTDVYAQAAGRLPDLKRPTTRAGHPAYRRRVLAHLSRLAAAPGEACPLDVEIYPEARASWARLRPFSFQSERGIVIPAVLAEPPVGPASRVVVYAHPAGKAAALDMNLARSLVEHGSAVLAMDLRGTGETEGLRPGEAAGFTLHRSIMLGRHISFMRAYDISRCIDAARAIDGYGQMPVKLLGEGAAATWALFAFALDARFACLSAAELLLTFKADKGFIQPDTIFPPGMLLGADVPDILATALERPILLARGELPHGRNVSLKEATRALSPAMKAARAARSGPPVIVQGGHEKTADAIVRFLCA